MHSFIFLIMTFFRYHSFEIHAPGRDSNELFFENAVSRLPSTTIITGIVVNVNVKRQWRQRRHHHEHQVSFRDGLSNSVPGVCFLRLLLPFIVHHLDISFRLLYFMFFVLQVVVQQTSASSTFFLSSSTIFLIVLFSSSSSSSSSTSFIERNSSSGSSFLLWVAVLEG